MELGRLFSNAVFALLVLSVLVSLGKASDSKQSPRGLKTGDSVVGKKDPTASSKGSNKLKEAGGGGGGGYSDLAGKWVLIDGYTIENSWSADEIVRRTNPMDATITSIGPGFYEIEIDFKFDSPVYHEGVLTSEFTSTKRMVETPTYDTTRMLEGINLEDPAVTTFWAMDGGNTLKYIYLEGGPTGTLVTKTMTRAE